MLDTLRRLMQEVNAAPDLAQVLAIITRRVKQAVGVEVCSIYLADPLHNQYVLMATDGLNLAAVGKVRLGAGEGLVSVVVENSEPLNLDDATDHPRYRYIAETGEEKLHAFLGVPIIHQRKVLGVLVARQRERRKFAENEEAFLVTVAAQLAGVIAHAEISGDIQGLHDNAEPVARSVEGLPGAPGVAVGTALVVYPPADLEAIPDRRITDIEAEVAAFRAAIAAAQMDISSLSERLSGALAAEDRALFDAYKLMLASESLVDRTIERIRAGSWASGALRETIREHARAFEEIDDPYLRERAEDVRDLGRRILMCLQASGRRNQPPYPARTVLVGEEITATMLAEVPPERLAGVVSVKGSGSSHVAILARAMSIPAVVGAQDMPVARIDGREIIVDGYRGRAYVQPNAGMREEYLRLAREEQQLAAGLEGLRNLPAITPDGVRIPLLANSGLLSDLSVTRHSGAEGIGLYRTEIPFMARQRFPSEEEQRRVYREVLESCAPYPVTLRTLDVGGDKALPYFPIAEDNPFLGWRGIRITLDHPEIFMTQLRAMLRASIGIDNLHILFPMISSTGELDEALRLLRRVFRELQDAEEEIVEPQVGVMIEVPSAVYQIEVLARRVDFISIGTNDLTQYILAVDRNNTRVAGLYDALHPAVLKAIMQVIEGAHRQHKLVSVCGEMASDPACAVLLLGMGIDSLSVSAASLPRIKSVIRTVTQLRARELLAEVLTLEDPREIRQYLHLALAQAGLGGLVNAGGLPEMLEPPKTKQSSPPLIPSTVLGS